LRGQKKKVSVLCIKKESTAKDKKNSGWEDANRVIMTSTGGYKGKSDDEKTRKWDGSAGKLEAFDKRIGRWCRKQHGTQLGNMFWENNLPTFLELGHGQAWQDHAELVWESINEKNTTEATSLHDINSGFWQHEWHRRWRKAQCEKLHDKVESCVQDMVMLELESLTMDNAPEIRRHLHEQFGGAGDDVRAREEAYEACMVEYLGAPGFPKNGNMENKLRTLQAKRGKLLKLCQKLGAVDLTALGRAQLCPAAAGGALLRLSLPGPRYSLRAICPYGARLVNVSTVGAAPEHTGIYGPLSQSDEIVPDETWPTKPCLTGHEKYLYLRSIIIGRCWRLSELLQL
jgi:hypothetical protein